MVTSEVVEYEPGEGRLAWSAKELGATGHHGWVLSERDGGTFVLTEETQRGWGMALAKPVLMPADGELAPALARGPGTSGGVTAARAIGDPHPPTEVTYLLF